MATATLSYNPADRWSAANLATFRANKNRRHKSDALIQKHLSMMEQVTAENGGVLPPYKWLEAHGYFQAYETMLQYPSTFAHIRRDVDPKYHHETAKAHDAALEKAATAAKAVAKAKPVILPPTNYKTISEYNINGAYFNPTELKLDAGLTEGEFMQVGRTLASMVQSAHWWVGDFLQYGFRQYGKRNTFDLAQQATSYSRGQLHGCSYLAKRFAPEQRVAALTWFHHNCVAAFPDKIALPLLADAVELGLTGRQIKQMGNEQLGKNKKRKRKRVPVFLTPEEYDELQEYVPCIMRTGSFIAELVREFLQNERLKKEQQHGDGVSAMASSTL